MAQVLSDTGSAAPIEPVVGEGAQQVLGRSPWQLFWRRFKRDKLAFVGLFLIALMILCAVLAPVFKNITGHDPNNVFLNTGALNKKVTACISGSFVHGVCNGILTHTTVSFPKPPNGTFWFGTNTAFQDVFVRVMYGARTSLIIAFFATGLSVLIGVVLGLMAGFYKGRVDTFISRTMDVVMSLPVLLLALGLVSACGATNTGCLGGLIQPGLLLVSYVIALFNWPYIARIVRGQTLSLREKEFIEASRALGANNNRIIFREVLPNVVAPILVYTTLIIPNNILFEAALSFLGIGVPAQTPSWGKMLSDASQSFTYAWWTMVFPGVFLFATTLAFNLVGDGLRDALDPRTGR